MTLYMWTTDGVIHVRCLYCARSRDNTFKILVFNIQLIVTTILRGKYCYSLFASKETEAQRS